MQLRTALWASAAATLLLAVTLAALPGDAARSALSDLLVVAGAALVVAATTWRSQRSDRPLAWRLMAAGAALFCLAEGYWLWQELVAAESVPAASVADVLYYAGYAFFVVALVALFPGRESLKPRLRRGLDTVALAATLMAIAWVGFLDRWSHAAGVGEAAAAIAGAYPALDLALAGSFGLLAVEVASPARRRLALLAGGWAVWAIADISYAREVLLGSYSSGRFLDAAWFAGYLAMAAAALAAPTRDATVVGGAGPTRASALALYIPVAVLLPLAAWDFARTRHMDATLFGLGIVMLATITARQVLLSWDLLRSNRDLAQANERFHLAARATSDVMWDHDLASDRIVWAPTIKTVFGHDVAVSRGSDWERLIHPDDRTRIIAAFDVALAGAASTFDAEYRFRREDGTYADVLDRAFIVRDDAGRALRLVGALQDVSHHKAAEAALRRSERQFHTLADNFPDYITRFDRELRRVYVNPAVREVWRKMGALDPEGRTADTTITPPAAAQELQEALRGALADGKVRKLRQTLPTPKGERILEGTIVPERGADGRVESLLTVARDVTDADAAERRLQASEARYRLLADHSSDLVQAFDPGGICTYCSPSALPVLGYRPEELVGKDGSTMLHPDDAAALRAGRLVVSRPDGIRVVEARARRKDGSWVWLETVSRVVQGSDGRTLGHVAASRDVSSRRAVAEALRASEERLRSLLDNLDEVYVSTDVTTGNTLNSRGIERIFGFPLGRYDADPMLWATQIHPDDRDRVMARYSELLAGTPTVNDCRIVRPDGEVRWIRASMRPVKDASGLVVRLDGVIRDITVERAAEQHQREVKRLEEVAAFKTQFLNSAAHELATPLTPIKLQMASFRRNLLGELQPNQREALDLLDRNLDRLSLLVQDLLDAARLQGGKLKVQAKPIVLGQVAREVLRSFSEKARADGLRLGGRGLDARIEVLGDDARLAQVLFNLVHNACKFTPRDGSVEISVATEGDEAVLAVRDTGIGLEPEQVARLFEPFTQVHDPLVRAVGGTGLGLYISRGIVEQHGGRLVCRSEGKGKGCTFQVRLPLRSATAAHPAGQAAGHAAARGEAPDRPPA